MKLDWWTLGLQLINVLVLMWLLSRFLFKPISQIIAERQRVAAELLDQAAAAKANAQALDASAQAANEQVAQTRAAALEAVQQEADAMRTKLLREAQACAADSREKAMQALQDDQRASRRRVEADAARLALDIAGKLLARLPADAQVSGFVEGLVAELARLPENLRDGLRQSAPRFELHAPRPLYEAEVAQIQQALATALDQPVTLDVLVDASLVAGLELTGGAVVVRNSFRADLDRLKDQLLDAEHA
ncbi:F0F1 ATP synthase subunit delta [Stutzerimonas chloritidismutans]|uniref:ATP synthase subunit b n=1 Tax=Stutzerimonas chloritidismutans TaxID=203192 RepID=A0ABU9M5X4_STUCH